MAASHNTNAQDRSDEMMNALTNKLIHHLLKASSLHSADLDHSILGKAGQLSVRSSSKYNPAFSPLRKNLASIHPINYRGQEHRIKADTLQKDTWRFHEVAKPREGYFEKLEKDAPPTLLKNYRDVTKKIADLGLEVPEIYYQASAGKLIEQAVVHEHGSHMTSTGALAVSSGKKTGRSPKDKRTVDEPTTTNDIWWGDVNIKLEERTFMMNRQRAIDFLNIQPRLFVIDGFAGWDKAYRIPIRVITTRAYHALFMQNMLVKPAIDELDQFEDPFIIYNAGSFPANALVKGMTSTTSVCLNLARNEMVILGTEYAGEMKKGVFTMMYYKMPLMPSRDLPLTQRALPLHSSANLGKDGDVSMFFGLSGTGKTTLSADPKRKLIGDDEHVWTSDGVFNIEGGCYAKCIGLTREKEPEIFDAIRFGSILENIVYNASDRSVDYSDTRFTENTRCAYPLEFIPNALIPAKIDTAPSNIILLTADAFGVLPPISKLSPEQVMYYFISGYTAKVAGTEDGLTAPQATFSACFGAPFLMMHPYVYAEMLAAKLQKHKANAWLINTGWIAGGYGEGERCPLKYTRQIVDSIHDGTLAALGDDEWIMMDKFGLMMPKNKVKDVPIEVLHPDVAWANAGRADDYEKEVLKLAGFFQDNFQLYQDRVPDEVLAAGPQCSQDEGCELVAEGAPEKDNEGD
eukprot:gnl/MRDRNA2_/MRDRNA2_58655_c0_seq1.p1 gnl/MRDRNA2_/MRDRNA2_58655_c0~~gnl/MRDRNA2_/MRDRNA2_58655_c0_seq1.p1  ORF type:complete len:729 (+),score=148.55 gnl/MRDRNA2_/MRDRNA2_58655_c0_seq1:126-2189(+)